MATRTTHSSARCCNKRSFRKAKLLNVPLRVLHVEDNPRDADLIHSMLEAEGIACTIDRVETHTDFQAAVEQRPYDLIMSDYSLPSFDGLSALEIAREKCPEVPFIFISGTIGEEIAVESLKGGATD